MLRSAVARADSARPAPSRHPSCRRPDRPASEFACAARSPTPLSTRRGAWRAGAPRARRDRSRRESPPGRRCARSTPAGRSIEAQLVAQIDELHRRLQQVIAIGATADDVQAQIELGRRRPGVGGPADPESVTCSLPELPAIDDDAHARVAAAGAASCTGTRAPGSSE